MTEREQLEKELEELKATRNRLSGIIDDVSQESLENEEQESHANLIENLTDSIKEIDSRIATIEEKQSALAKEYENFYQEINSIVKEYESKIDSSYSEENLNDLVEKTEREKLEANEKSIETIREMEEQKKALEREKRKKRELEKDLKMAEAFELTYDEYKEITATINRRNTINSILESKGLNEIIEKNYKERTKEEKKILSDAKKEILSEVINFKKDHEDYSVLESIEALYSLGTKYTRVNPPKKIEVQSKELAVVEDKIQSLSLKVVNPTSYTNTYPKEEMPKDMENAKRNENVDIKQLAPAEEKVTIFKDNDNYYVRKYAIERFEIDSLGEEVRINGSLCYKISDHDVERIKENANNANSPYIASIKEVTIEKTIPEVKESNKDEISKEDTKDELIPGTGIKRPRDRKPNETDEEYELFLKEYYDKVFPQEEKVELTEEEIEKEIKEAIEEEYEITPEDTKDELIPGTNIKRPRDRKPNETDEEYELFLKEYYDKAFPQEEKEDLTEEEIEKEIKEAIEEEYEITPEDTKDELIPGTNIKRPRDRKPNETDEEYEAFLKKYYDKAFPQEEKEDLTEEDINNTIDESIKEENSDEEKLEASNIKATKEFKKELKRGNVLYNIIHVIPKGVKRVVNWFRNNTYNYFELQDMLHDQIVGEKEDQDSFYNRY